jgi:hypothetical protein
MQEKSQTRSNAQNQREKSCSESQNAPPYQPSEEGCSQYHKLGPGKRQIQINSEERSPALCGINQSKKNKDVVIDRGDACVFVTQPNKIVRMFAPFQLEKKSHALTSFRFNADIIMHVCKNHPYE